MTPNRPPRPSALCKRYRRPVDKLAQVDHAPAERIAAALGARNADIFRLVIGQGLRLTLAGVVLGISGALAVTRFARSLLFANSVTDPWTFDGIAVLFVAMALLACALPARRAARIDLMPSLRTGWL